MLNNKNKMNIHQYGVCQCQCRHLVAS